MTGNFRIRFEEEKLGQLDRSLQFGKGFSQEEYRGKWPAIVPPLLRLPFVSPVPPGALFCTLEDSFGPGSRC